MRRALASLAAGLAVAAAFLSPAAAAPERPTLRVFAAASLTEVVGALAAGYEGARVEPSFGASSALARQIRDGAPADVFVSASPAWIGFLRDAGALASEPVVLARNRLVCVASRRSGLGDRGIDGPRALLEALGPGGRVAIADEGVPAGAYARAALAHRGLLDAYLPHLAGQRDVRAVLHAVEQGWLPAGFVYATDARVADVALLFAFDPSGHPPIEYRAAVVRDARHAEQARRFLDHLQDDEARALLARAGFALP